MEEGLRLNRERQRGIWSFTDGSVVKNLLANAEDAGDVGSIPRLGRSPGERNGNPLQYCRSLAGYSPRGRKESDTTEQLHFHFL